MRHALHMPFRKLSAAAGAEAVLTTALHADAYATSLAPQEAELALRQALKLSLTDAALLQALGEAYLDLSQFRLAAEALLAGVRQRDAFEVSRLV